MALNWILGHPDQNSYVNATYADEYFKYRTDTKEWDDCVKIEKQAALVQAAQDLEQYNYIGDVYYDSQGLQFPRDDHEIVTGNCASPITRTTFSNTSLYSTTYNEVPEDYWKNGSVHFTEGTPVGERVVIRASDETDGTLTFDPVATPNENTEFIVFAPVDRLIMHAQCEQALFLLKNKGMDQVQAYKMAGARRVDIGDVRVDYQEKHMTKVSISPQARVLLGRWIRRGYLIYRA